MPVQSVFQYKLIYSDISEDEGLVKTVVVRMLERNKRSTENELKWWSSCFVQNQEQRFEKTE